jgi:hypothetical protein
MPVRAAFRDAIESPELLAIGVVLLRIRLHNSSLAT